MIEHLKSERINGNPTLASALLSREARELRETWQARLMYHARGRSAAIVMVMIAHNWYEQLDVLCRVVWPGFKKMNLPCLQGPAKIARTGQVYCDMINSREERVPHCVLFASETEMRDFWRRLADDLKFTDSERADMFRGIQNWVVADYRVNERGEKVA